MTKVIQWVSLVAVLTLLGIVVFNSVPRSKESVSFLGSVAQGNEYHTTSTCVGTTAGVFAITSSTNGALGSVVIVSSTSGNGNFALYDADGSATSTLAIFKEGVAAGTYTFDVALFRGLRMSIPTGFNGCFATTYR